MFNEDGCVMQGFTNTQTSLVSRLTQGQGRIVLKNDRQDPVYSVPGDGWAGEV